MSRELTAQEIYELRMDFIVRAKEILAELSYLEKVLSMALNDVKGISTVEDLEKFNKKYNETADYLNHIELS